MSLVESPPIIYSYLTILYSYLMFSDDDVLMDRRKEKKMNSIACHSRDIIISDALSCENSIIIVTASY